MNKRSFYALPSAHLLPNRWDVLAILLVVGLIMLFAWAGSHMTLGRMCGWAAYVSHASMRQACMRGRATYARRLYILPDLRCGWCRFPAWLQMWLGSMTKWTECTTA